MQTEAKKGSEKLWGHLKGQEASGEGEKDLNTLQVLEGTSWWVSRHPSHCLTTVCLSHGHTASPTALLGEDGTSWGLNTMVRILGLPSVSFLPSFPEQCHCCWLWGVSVAF